MRFTRSHQAQAPETSVGRARALLGDEAIGLSDDQVAATTRHADVLARVVVEAYLAHTLSAGAA